MQLGSDMKKLIWKIQYALRIRQQSKGPFLFCWGAACIGLHEMGDDWRDWSGRDAADEEMTYWND